MYVKILNMTLTDHEPTQSRPGFLSSAAGIVFEGATKGRTGGKMHMYKAPRCQHFTTVKKNTRPILASNESFGN
jgi:hypothetical protein